MNTTQQFKKQLPRNAATAILQFVVSCMAAIWLTPYLLKHLGPAAFGLVPLAALFTQYVALITAQLSLAVRRFLIIEIQKPGGNPNIVFNSVLALYLLVIVLQAPLFAGAILKINTFFSIPAELLLDAQILFCCSAAIFLLTLLFGVFGISIYAHNRIDISSTINLVRCLLRLILIIVLFSLFGPKLRYIGYIELLAVFFVGFCNLYYWRKLTPELTVNLRHIDVKIFPPIFKMSLWTLVNNFGAMLFMRTDIWIINKFISPIVAGQYAAILVIVEFIRRIGLLMCNQSGPVIMNHFAKGEWVALRRLLQMWTKVTAIIIAIPIGIICTCAPELLKVWLGDEFVFLTPVVWLTVAYLFISVGIGSQSNLQIVANKVKIPGIVTLITGIVYIVFVYWLGIVLDMGVIGIALGGAIVVTLKDVLFTCVYGARILKLPGIAFIKPLISSLLVFVFILIISLLPIAKWLGLGAGYASLAITAVCGSIAAVIFIWFVLTTKKEKTLFLEMLPGKASVYVRRFVGS